MKTTRPVPGQLEDRHRPVSGDVEQRAAPTAAPTMDGPRLRGLVPYGVESRDLGGWSEIIEPGALRNARTDDLIATVDHGGVPLARHPGTLELEDRSDGLAWSLTLPESRSDVREAVERGDLCAGSWRMIVGRDEWCGSVRHVHEIAELRDVSVVSSPAYSASTVEHRSAPPAPPAGPTPGRPQRPALRVEDRAEHAAGRTVEARVRDAMRAVPEGEARDLTRATTDPVQPDDLQLFVWDRLREQSVVLASGVPIVDTDRGKVTWPTIVSDTTATFLNELDPIPTSDLGLADFTIEPRAIKALVRGSSEAFSDSQPSLLDLVVANLTTTLALRLDLESLVGNTAKGFAGLTTMPGTQTLAVGGALTNYDALIKAAAALAEAFIPPPYVAIMHPRVAAGLALLKTETGSNEALAAPAGAPLIRTSTLLPVTPGATTGASPTSTVVVFAPAMLAMARRLDTTIEVDRSKEFDSDAVLVRGKVRAALGTPHPAAVIKLTGVASPSVT